MELKKLINDLNKNVGQKYDDGVHRLLDRMGLQEKPSTAESLLPMLGIFGAGIAVGATLGVLFAPKRGDDLRHDIRHSLEDLQKKGKQRATQLVERSHEGEGNGRLTGDTSGVEAN